jgi:excisionase family DNA binding protein
MPRAKTKSSRPPRNGAAAPPQDVMTLAEAAAYLRVAEEDVLRLVREQGLPGRRVGDDWRFLKAAVERWLGTPAGPDQKDFWEALAKMPKDDPYLEDMLKEIFRRRGRPEAEEP